MSWLGCKLDGFGSTSLWRLNGRRRRKSRFEAGCLRLSSIRSVLQIRWVPWVLRIQRVLWIRWVPAVLPNLSRQSSIRKCQLVLPSRTQPDATNVGNCVEPNIRKTIAEFAQRANRYRDEGHIPYGRPMSGPEYPLPFAPYYGRGW